MSKIITLFYYLIYPNLLLKYIIRYIILYCSDFFVLFGLFKAFIYCIKNK